VELTPSGMSLSGARQLGHSHPVGIGSGTILIHPEKIEHGYGKSKLARYASCGNPGTSAGGNAPPSA
jgi:hypothetical protein